MNSVHSIMSRMNPRLVNLFELGYFTAPQQGLTEKNVLEGQGESTRRYREQRKWTENRTLRFPCGIGKKRHVF